MVSKGRVNPMPMADHQEADTRICPHVEDALQNGASITMVRTVDSDIVVILVGIFFQLKMHYPDFQLWVGHEDYCPVKFPERIPSIV